MTLKKKIGWTAGILLVLIVGICIGGSLYLIDFSLRRKTGERIWKNLKRSCELNIRRLFPGWTACNSTMPCGIRLSPHQTASGCMRFYARASRPTRRTAIIVHGYTDNAIRMFHIGYLYNHSLNYNILLPDLRYTGLTEGDAIQMGWLDRKDVLQWIDTAPALFGDSLKAVVHGISMGAATTMMVSGEKTPEYITCFVEDCGYTSVWDQFSKELKGLFGLPPFPLLYTASWICQLQNGWNFRKRLPSRRWLAVRSPCSLSMATTMILSPHDGAQGVCRQAFS